MFTVIAIWTPAVLITAAIELAIHIPKWYRHRQEMAVFKKSHSIWAKGWQ